DRRLEHRGHFERIFRPYWRRADCRQCERADGECECQPPADRAPSAAARDVAGARHAYLHLSLSSVGDLCRCGSRRAEPLHSSQKEPGRKPPTEAGDDLCRRTPKYPAGESPKADQPGSVSSASSPGDFVRISSPPPQASAMSWTIARPRPAPPPDSS